MLIDQQLVAAGWLVQDKRDLNLFAAQGVAVQESIMAAGHGRADYLLYVGKSAVGVIEAKPEGTPLSGVEWQSAMYAEGLPARVRLKALTLDGRLPFVLRRLAPKPTTPVATIPSHEHAGCSTSPSPRPSPASSATRKPTPQAPTWRI